MNATHNQASPCTDGWGECGYQTLQSNNNSSSVGCPEGERMAMCCKPATVACAPTHYLVLSHRHHTAVDNRCLPRPQVQLLASTHRLWINVNPLVLPLYSCMQVTLSTLGGAPVARNPHESPLCHSHAPAAMATEGHTWNNYPMQRSNASQWELISVLPGQAFEATVRLTPSNTAFAASLSSSTTHALQVQLHPQPLVYNLAARTPCGCVDYGRLGGKQALHHEILQAGLAGCVRAANGNGYDDCVPPRPDVLFKVPFITDSTGGPARFRVRQHYGQ